jgi:uncharacterized protein YfcZ (UPF0381/DUF406 family)
MALRVKKDIYQIKDTYEDECMVQWLIFVDRDSIEVYSKFFFKCQMEMVDNFLRF